MGVLVAGARLLGVYIRASGFCWKLPVVQGWFGGGVFVAFRG